jgi:hypothetical protein
MTMGAIAVGVLAGVLAGGVAAAAPREAERPASAVERPSKPVGPIAVEYRIAGQPTVGVPLSIAVSARAAGGEALAIEAAPSDARALQVGAPVPVATSAGGFEWTIAVVPFAADAGFVNVLVTATIDGVAQARSIAIPVRTAAHAAGEEPRTEGGEPLIALPVEEGR